MGLGDYSILLLLLFVDFDFSTFDKAFCQVFTGCHVLENGEFGTISLCPCDIYHRLYYFLLANMSLRLPIHRFHQDDNGDIARTYLNKPFLGKSGEEPSTQVTWSSAFTGRLLKIMEHNTIKTNTLVSFFIVLLLFLFSFGVRLGRLPAIKFIRHHNPLVAGGGYCKIIPLSHKEEGYVNGGIRRYAVKKFL